MEHSCHCGARTLHVAYYSRPKTHPLPDFCLPHEKRRQCPLIRGHAYLSPPQLDEAASSVQHARVFL